jgi:hypothetical protein
MERHISEYSILYVFVAKVTSFFIRLSHLVLYFTNLVITVSIINRVKLVVYFSHHLVEKVSAGKVVQIDPTVR